jgi:hypothetical protein
MQMLGCQVGLDHPLVNRLQPQIEDFGYAMIDPDDSVIMNSHDLLLFD